MSNRIRKHAKKMVEGRCRFCGESDPSLLDSHRIVPGSAGGVYHERNEVTVCANCHRRVHAGTIVIDRKYLSTHKGWILHYWLDGVERWD